jgi:hypothetical protein
MNEELRDTSVSISIQKYVNVTKDLWWPALRHGTPKKNKEKAPVLPNEERGEKRKT